VKCLLFTIAVPVALLVLGDGLPKVLAADPAPAAESRSAGAPETPAVEEWLNQTVRLRETLQAMSEPLPDGKSAGEIRAGAEVKAIGLVAGKRWVEIELPDHSRAYIPKDAIQYEDNAAAAVPEANQKSAGPPASSPPPPVSAGSPAAPPASARASSPEIAAAAAPGAIRGAVNRVPNAATLVVADQRIRLSGIDPGPSEVLAPFESWLRGQGELLCEPDAQTGRYHCFTSGGVDVAQAAILNGAGRVGDGATTEYRNSETQARQGNRGLWRQP
jgi:endonuclease YncB( thermonuclease family)